jgi:hypothetical protein
MISKMTIKNLQQFKERFDLKEMKKNLIGSGGFGKVFSSKDRIDGIEYAIKCKL